MKIEAYLNFDGQCREAFNFYGQLLGGSVRMMSVDESPMAGQLGPEWKGRVIHARLEVGDQVLMASDSPPGQHQRAQGMWVSLQVTDPGEAERIFNAFAEGGAVVMPLQKTFWSEKYGMVTDRYGTPWMVNFEPNA